MPAPYPYPCVSSNPSLRRSTLILVFALHGMMASLETPVNAAIVFTDPSFENPGDATPLTMAGSPNWRTTFGANNVDSPLSGATVARWHTLTGDSIQNGLLQDKDSYLTGNTINPANVNGEQFLSYARTQYRSAMQLINDGQSSTGTYTFSINYWVGSFAGANSTANIAFEVFAFNAADLGNVTWQARSNDGDSDTIKAIGATSFVSAGGTYSTIANTAASSGFQTISYDLDLGTGYDYIGVAVTAIAANESNVFVAFDNLQIAVVPEPTSVALAAAGLGLFGCIAARRFRRT